MTGLHVYLTFNGNCEEAFNFYQSVFGGEIPYIGRYKDMPAEGGKTASPAEAERIMHISLMINDKAVLMGSDTGGEWAANYKHGNNFSLSINAESNEEADRLHASLSAGGQVTMPMDNTFWGDYFGMVVDKFGISWMISASAKKDK